MSFDCNLQAGIGQHNAGNLGQTLACARKQISTKPLPKSTSDILANQSAGCIMRSQHGVQLLQEAGAHLLFFFYCLLTKKFGLLCVLFRLFSLRRKYPLLFERSLLGLFRFLAGLFGFGLGLLGLQLRGFCVLAGLLGFGAALWLPLPRQLALWPSSRSSAAFFSAAMRACASRPRLSA